MLVDQVQSTMNSAGAQGATVNVTNRNSFNECEGFKGDCEAGFIIGSTGVLKEIGEEGALIAIDGEWMVGGTDPDTDADGFYVERTINSGSLDTDDLSGGRTQCTTDLELSVRIVSSGSQSCNVTATWYDAASGGTAQDSATWTIAVLMLP